ncbi:hydroxysteroid 11-beta-dehydrogenase 1-like protein [Hypomesus transpacificus]|uniref:hydroxysteroid 11-beta-dehydrogenase 1-like protein n=1 Tax=Hypomesus transpacificus TaxID=137520 RepID=UPI001F087782|nr:hydroxysteroid 11-beta-dehydrogenase 1-like protein [Hypomesus transpacificus]
MRTLSKLFLVGALGVFLAVQWNAPTFDPESLRGARVFVTGASTGIGEQTAYHYARLGAQLVITARREHVLHRVSERCQVLGAQQARYLVLDMAEPQDAERAVGLAADLLGGLDVVVLNHIGSSPFSMWDGDIQHLRWLMQVNFLSYVQMAKAALPLLEPSGGSLVVVSSLLAKMSSPFVAPYSSTKFALNGFFGTLQQELAMKNSNVSISIATLGLIDTDNAMEKVRDMVTIPAYPASEAALALLRVGASRQAETYYPQYLHLLALVRDWAPSVRDWVMRSSYNYTP